jgi:hypothetical protein
MPTHGYSIVPTRIGMEGVIDKIILIEDTGDEYAQNREIQDLLLKKVLSGVGSGADEQLKAWEQFLEKLPYRREAGEIIRKPTETAKYGGDCDDLTALAIAGARAIGLPAMAEVIANSNGDGFHVRALVGLPPIGQPKQWIPLDPVHWSEPTWAMAKTHQTSESPTFPGASPNVGGITLAQIRRQAKATPLVPILGLVAAVWLLSRK